MPAALARRDAARLGFKESPRAQGRAGEVLTDSCEDEKETQPHQLNDKPDLEDGLRVPSGVDRVFGRHDSPYGLDGE